MGIISLLFCLWRSGRHFLLQFHPPQQGGSSNGCHVPEVWLPPLIGRGNPTHPPSKPSLQEAFVNCTLHQVSPVAAPRCPQRLEASYGKKLFCGRPPGVSSSLYLPTSTSGLGPPIRHQGRSLLGLLPEKAGAACTSCRVPAILSQGCTCLLLVSWCKGTGT